MLRQSIATIHGDLSNITAPPFILDTKSSVELPAFWAERPVVFVAPAASQNPAERALLVLKWFVSSLRNQQYAGRSESQGVKKPINSFLGEVFLANWEDEAGLTRLVSEQVRLVDFSPHNLTIPLTGSSSHHPPVTACRVWNEEHGVSVRHASPRCTFCTIAYRKIDRRRAIRARRLPSPVTSTSSRSAMRRFKLPAMTKPTLYPYRTSKSKGF